MSCLPADSILSDQAPCGGTGEGAPGAPSAGPCLPPSASSEPYLPLFSLASEPALLCILSGSPLGSASLLKEGVGSS